MEHRINNVHERFLRLIFPSDSKLTFKELLDINKTASTHQKDLQLLGTEIFKEKLNISPEILKQLFSFNIRNYNLTSQSTLKLKKKKNFCVLWQRKPLLTGTEDMGLGSRQFQKLKFTRNV